MKLTSSVAVAQEAAAGIAAIKTDIEAHTVEIGSSNIASMRDGAAVANTALDGIFKLSATLISHARNIDSLAKQIEQRDSLDAAIWGAEP